MAHRGSQARCQIVQTSYIKRIELFLFLPDIMNILLPELSRSVWKNLDLGRVYRPHCVRSVLSTSVKIHILLTKHEGGTGRISARGLDSTDLAALGPYKKDQGPIFSQDGPEQAWLMRDLLYD